MLTNAQLFLETYQVELTKRVRENPEKYSYPVDRVPEIAAKMTASLSKGTGNKDSLAIKATCKKLGIAYRYKDIKDYLCL